MEPGETNIFLKVTLCTACLFLCDVGLFPLAGVSGRSTSIIQTQFSEWLQDHLNAGGGDAVNDQMESLINERSILRDELESRLASVNEHTTILKNKIRNLMDELTICCEANNKGNLSHLNENSKLLDDLKSVVAALKEQKKFLRNENIEIKQKINELRSENINIIARMNILHERVMAIENLNQAENPIRPEKSDGYHTIKRRETAPEEPVSVIWAVNITSSDDFVRKRKFDEELNFLKSNMTAADANMKAELIDALNALDQSLRVELSKKVDFLPNSSSAVMVNNCSDLFENGHRFSGMHVVQKGTKYDLIFCNFTKSSQQPGFETRIGQINLKWSPVYFYVQRNTVYNKINTTIPYELERLNVGSAMNLTSGVFTAPRNGVYYFAFTAIDSNDSINGGVFIRLNGANIGMAYGESSSYTQDNPSGSFHSTLKLKAGDRIDTYLGAGAIHDAASHYTHFTGFLVEEEF